MWDKIHLNITEQLRVSVSQRDNRMLIVLRIQKQPYFYFQSNDTMKLLIRCIPCRLETQFLLCSWAFLEAEYTDPGVSGSERSSQAWRPSLLLCHTFSVINMNTRMTGTVSMDDSNDISPHFRPVVEGGFLNVYFDRQLTPKKFQGFALQRVITRQHPLISHVQKSIVMPTMQCFLSSYWVSCC